MLSPDEKIYFYPLFVLVILIPLLNYFGKEKTSFWSPMTFICLIYAYYTVLGPYNAIKNDDTTYMLLDHRPFFLNAWKVSLLSFFGILIGFYFTTKPFKNSFKLSDVDIKEDFYDIYGKRFFIGGVICVMVVFGVGGFANQLDFINSSSGYEAEPSGAFVNYFLHGMNLLVGASCLLLLSFLNKNQRIILFLMVVFFAVAIYTKQGFRWRHVILGLSLLMTYFIYNRRKVNLLLFSVLGIFGIILMGYIEKSRSYGTGLDTEKVEDLSSEQLFLDGLGESSIFMSTGYVVEKVPRDYDFVGIAPITQTLAQPIPRVLWENKPMPEQLEILESMYQEIHPMAGKGAAITNYGEMYMAFGYWGVLIGSLLIGWLCKRFWLWFQLNKEDPFVIVIYAVGCSFLYMVISRGYLPQVVMLFMFTVFPLIWTYRLIKKKYIQ